MPEPDGEIGSIVVTVTNVTEHTRTTTQAFTLLDDVTARHQAEVKLLRSEMRFRLLVEHAQDVIFHMRLEPAPRLDYLSPAIEALTGYSRDAFHADDGLSRRLQRPDDVATFASAARPDSGRRGLR